MKKKMIAAAALLLLLTGCSSMSEGQVVGKHYYEAYQTTTYMCTMYTKGVCTMYMPQQHWNPERWVLDLEKDEDTGSLSVPENVYNQYSVGDYYTSEK